MDIKIIQNSKFVYTLYTKIAQLKFLHIYKKCTSCAELVQSSN